MATELQKINNPASWRTAGDIALSTGRVAACGLLAPMCLAQELGARAGTAAALSAVTQVEGQIASGESFLDDLAENASQVLGNATQPLDRVADISMWVAIGVIALSAAIIVTIIVVAVKT